MSALLAGGMALLTGCAAGPDYVPPRDTAPTAWHTDLQGGLKPEPADPRVLAQWWSTLNDPVLSQLITRASEGNRDLAAARARIREARAQRGVTAAAWYPAVDAGVSGTRNTGNAGGGTDATRELYSAGFDAQWEIDLFGGTRRAVEAADAEVQASTEQLHDVLVTLLAEVALNYVDVRALQQRLVVAEDNLKTQTQTRDIARWREQAGLGDALESEQAQAALEQTRAQLPTLRTSLAQARNRLAVLTGVAPGAVDALLAQPAPVPVTPLAIAVGVPADALRQRPDVRRAERLLAAQTARVGVASAAQYPNLALIGSIGVEALSPDGLFTAAMHSSSLGANLAMPIFNAGRIRQSIAVQSALQEQALAAYETSVLTALEDVENALVAYAQEQNRRTALRVGTAASQQAALLANSQYASGLIDYLVVLVTQRSLLSLQDQLVVSEAEVTANLVRLYKALGGGWVPMNANAEQ